MATPENDLERLVAVYSDEVKALETATLQVLTDTTLASSVGAQLDGIGEILGFPRQGLADDTYRNRLRARGLVLRSRGTANDLIGVVEAFFDGLATFTYNEGDNFSAGFEIDISSTLLQGAGGDGDYGDGRQVGLEVRRARAGGVNGYVTYHQSTPIFALDGAGGFKFDGGSRFRATQA